MAAAWTRRGAWAERAATIPRRALGVLGGLLLGGCAPEPETQETGIEWLVEVTQEDGAAVERFAASVADDGVIVGEASCPEWATEGLECAEEGLRLRGAADRVDVTIKARGYRFQTTTLDAEQPHESVDEVQLWPVALEALAPFESHSEYATGFDESGGIAVFDALAAALDTELGSTRVVKWYLELGDGESDVYFQNTRTYPLHYAFARNVLGVPLTLPEFEATTYEGQDRTAMAGTVTLFPSVTVRSSAITAPVASPLVVTFFPSDDLTPEQARVATRLLEERLGFAGLVGGAERILYQPAGDVQEAELEQTTGEFVREAVGFVTHQEMYGDQSMQILNPGLAYGTLRVLSPEALEQTVVSAQDVLVLTRLPNSLPIVAGTITEELQTPLAHVNVAARTRGTPNIAWLEASSDPQVASLVDEIVRFEVDAGRFTLELATLAEATAFWESRERAPLVPTFDATREGLPLFEELGFADALVVGAKAANLSELRRLLGDVVPDGFAVPFFYYDAFMRATEVGSAECAAAEGACVDSGRAPADCAEAAALCGNPPASGTETLFQHAERLLGDSTFQSNTSVRDAALLLLRHHILTATVDPSFATALNARVRELVGAGKVKLRSSTNTEDLPNFSGAGLYESVGAYASGQDIASLRIREVWASVWSWAAFEERSYWNIDHLAVRMACAVNPAQSDEAANGVLVTQNLADPTVAGMYVNVQLGEVSVTNPEGGAVAEVFSIIPAPAGVQVARQRYSSLSSDVPILSQAEIVELFLAAAEIQEHFAGLYGESPEVLALELEFKFVGDERALVVKQVRPYVRG